MKTLELKDRAAWREWLAANHDRENEVWLVYYKKETGIPSIQYTDSLDEALCYGWVDSLIKKIDEQRYARKFTPRKDGSKWSLVNKERVEQLIQQGRMTEHGMKKVEAARLSGSWDSPVQKPKLDFTMPEEFAEALQNNPEAESAYNDLSASHQKQYLAWIITAKRPETKQKRIAESIQLLSEGKKLGLR
ncbi:MAG: YdeI/OmpD-associated family protein [Anaerolineales bacterium]